MQTDAGRLRYRYAFRHKMWNILGKIPWEMDVRRLTVHSLRMVLSPRDQRVSRELFVTGMWEPEEVHAIESLVTRGMTVIDVGANIGAHTLLLAKLVGVDGVVHAFEPTVAYERLERNIQLNNLEPRVRLNKSAVGARGGFVKLYECKPGFEAYTSSGAPCESDCWSGGYIQSPMISLDDYAQKVGVERVDLMKIDIEGAELDAFIGCADLFRRGAVQAILFEINKTCLRNNACMAESVLDYLKTAGFTIRTLDGIDYTEADLQTMQSDSVNLLATLSGAPERIVRKRDE